MPGTSRHFRFTLFNRNVTKGKPNMWCTCQETIGKIGDWITEKTGLAAVPVPLERASRKRQVTLDIRGYLQTNSYSCGAVSAAMVTKFFYPRMSFDRIYNAIEPDPDNGASTTKMKKGLRACGVSVAPVRRLKFPDLCDAIDHGCPVIVSIYNPDATCGHWVVVYGYGKRSDRVFVAGNSLPWIGKNPVTRRQFEAIWYPRGNGLVCDRNRPRSRGIRKKSASALKRK